MEKMLQQMMARYKLFIGMGVMIVVLAVIIGAVNSSNANAYFSVDKVTRESSLLWAETRAGFESTVIWLPYLKFLGLAMILAGISMALGVISLKLQKLGQDVMGGIPENARLAVPERPRSVILMRISMMLGMLIIVAGFIIALVTAGTAASVFSNPITTVDAAATGSPLLQDLASIQSTESWLEAFKFVGVASFFVAIISGLSTIIFALQYQKKAIPEVVDNLPTMVVPAPATGD